MGAVRKVPSLVMVMFLHILVAHGAEGTGVVGSAWNDTNTRKLLQSGKCGPTAKCAANNCCSQYGFCGSTSVYCGAGCQPAYGTCSSSGKCGASAGRCAGSNCCSKSSYCGSTADYCGTGCQSAYGTCWSTGTPKPPPISITPPPISTTPPPITPPAELAFGVSRARFSCVFTGGKDILGNTNTPAIIDQHWAQFKTAAAGVGFAGFQNNNEAATFFGNVKHEYGGFLNNMVENCYRTTKNPSSCPCYNPCPNGPNNYFGRGPLQLTHKYNYDAMTKYVGLDLGVNFANVADPTRDISWRTALAFWIKPDFNCQGSWIAGNPPTCPVAARVANLAAVTRRINGEIECGKTPRPASQTARVATIQGVFTSCFALPKPITNAFC